MIGRKQWELWIRDYQHHFQASLLDATADKPYANSIRFNWESTGAEYFDNPETEERFYCAFRWEAGCDDGNKLQLWFDIDGEMVSREPLSDDHHANRWNGIETGIVFQGQLGEDWFDRFDEEFALWFETIEPYLARFYS